MNFIKSRFKEILIWAAYFLLLFSLAYDNWGTVLNGAEVALFMVLIHGIIFYGNYHVLLPNTLAKQRYSAFFLGAILFAISWFLLTYVVFYWALNTAYWTSPEHIGPWSLRSIRRKEVLWTLRIGVGGINVFFISMLSFYAEQDKLKKQRLLELEHEKASAELKLLRMQINPHFLFNALNNIYSRAVLEKSTTAASIHQLSSLLRYTLYDCDGDQVGLMQEIEYIDNYIDLQSIEEEFLENIDLQVHGNIAVFQIAPMLLIPFVENAFKHGNIKQGGWIRIDLEADAKGILFKCKNSIAENRVQVKDSASGIGLMNVKKRLALHYPNRHELTINNKKNVFEIILRIDN